MTKAKEKVEETTEEIPQEVFDQDMLLAPFHENEIDYLAAATSGQRALAVAYIDARDVETRLDSVVGVDNWHDQYRLIYSDEKRVVMACMLTVNRITKEGIGEATTSDREPFKSAESDSLKRAAVKFGVGRFLYYLPKDAWVAYDPQRKKILIRPFTNVDLMTAAAYAGWKGCPAPEKPVPELPKQDSLSNASEAGYTGEERPAPPRQRPPVAETPTNQPVGCSMNNCQEKVLPPAVVTFSIKNFGRPLCRQHQQQATRI